VTTVRSLVGWWITPGHGTRVAAFVIKFPGIILTIICVRKNFEIYGIWVIKQKLLSQGGINYFVPCGETFRVGGMRYPAVAAMFILCL
jgi:hypothetical protein